MPRPHIRVVHPYSLPGHCAFGHSCGTGFWEESTECVEPRGVKCCKPAQPQYVKPGKENDRCQGGQGLCSNPSASLCNTFGIFKDARPGCESGLICCMIAIPSEPHLGDECGNGEGVCMKHEPCDESGDTSKCISNLQCPGSRDILTKPRCSASICCKKTAEDIAVSTPELRAAAEKGRKYLKSLSGGDPDDAAAIVDAAESARKEYIRSIAGANNKRNRPGSTCTAFEKGTGTRVEGFCVVENDELLATITPDLDERESHGIQLYSAPWRFSDCKKQQESLEENTCSNVEWGSKPLPNGLSGEMDSNFVCCKPEKLSGETLRALEHIVDEDMEEVKYLLHRLPLHEAAEQISDRLLMTTMRALKHLGPGAILDPADYGSMDRDAAARGEEIDPYSFNSVMDQNMLRSRLTGMVRRESGESTTAFGRRFVNQFKDDMIALMEGKKRPHGQMKDKYDEIGTSFSEITMADYLSDESFFRKLEARANKVHTTSERQHAVITGEEAEAPPAGDVSSFGYMHRANAAMAPLIFGDQAERVRYDKFRHAMISIGRLGLGEKYSAIGRYFENSPGASDVSVSDEPSMQKAIRAMEGNPYMAAWSIDYISQRNVKSSAPLMDASWLDQPLELDIYLPDGLEKRDLSTMHEWNKIVDDIKVGHAGTIDMAKELFFGCGVTESSDEISGFISLRAWFQMFNAALQFLVGELDQSDLVSNIVKERSALSRGSTFRRLFKTDMRIVLDVKCHFSTEILDALVRQVNMRFGVIVEGVGSFYALPELREPQVPALGSEASPPRIYTFFFSPDNLREGHKEGRIKDGAFALITASSILHMETEKKKGFWPFGKGKCTGYTIDQGQVDKLRRAKRDWGLKLGVWTLEADLGVDAFRTIVKFVDENTDLFPLGFQLGGVHNAGDWPLETCSLRGGRQGFGLMRNIKAKAARSWDSIVNK